MSFSIIDASTYVVRTDLTFPLALKGYTLLGGYIANAYLSTHTCRKVKKQLEESQIRFLMLPNKVVHSTGQRDVKAERTEQSAMLHAK